MEYEIILSTPAEKNLDRIPKKIRTGILDVLEGLRFNPRPTSCLKMKGEDDLWRIRVGDYRVVYTVQDEKLIVIGGAGRTSQRRLSVAHHKSLFLLPVRRLARQEIILLLAIHFVPDGVREAMGIGGFHLFGGYGTGRKRRGQRRLPTSAEVVRPGEAPGGRAN